MRQRLRLLCVAASLLSAVSCVQAQAQTTDLAQQFRDLYRNKTRLLRGFFGGDHLLYDFAGEPTGTPSAGDWTADGFIVIDDIHQSGALLVIEARRRLITQSRSELAFAAAKKRSDRGKDLGPAKLKSMLTSENLSLRFNGSMRPSEGSFSPNKTVLLTLCPNTGDPASEKGCPGKT